MKFKLTLLVFFLTALFNLNGVAQAPPVLDWQECLGGSGLDLPNKIIHSNDSGYIIAGSTTSNNGNITVNYGVRDIWVIKTNANGAIQWQKSFGGSASDVTSGLFQLSNNDIVIAGSTSSSNGTFTGNHGRSDYCLIRLDQSGNLIWQKTFGGSSDDFCYSMDLTSDGGFILGGSSSSNNGNVSGNHGSIDFWIVKTDSLGNLEWQQSLGGSGAEDCRSIKATSDGGFLASGYSNSVNGQVSGNHGGSDYWVVKLDNIGNIQWEKSLGGSSNDLSTTALQDISGHFVVAGYSNSNDGDISDPHGSSDYWLAILDSTDGSLLSQHSYGGSNSDIAYDLIVTADSGYMLVGGSYSVDLNVTGNHGGEDFWLTKTDAAGNIAWARSYGGQANDRPSSIIQNADGGFSVVGYTYSDRFDVSGNHGAADIWFLKLSCLTPVSNFILPVNQVCVHSTLSFTNTSVHSAQSEWNIDDVPFSSNTNTNFQFNRSGTHKISLISSTCYETDTVEKFIHVYDYPVPSISSSSSYLCQGNSATLSTINSDSYVWSNGETTSSIDVSAGGAYSVTVTINGCSASTSYSINEYSYPVPDLGNDTAICVGSSITLRAHPGYQNYVWQDGSTNSTFNVTGNGSYSVSVSNGYCSSSDTILVSAISNPVPSISSASSYFCAGNTATLSVNTADQYRWSNGETTSSINIHSGGIYSVTVTTDGCSASATFPISQYSNPVIDLGNDTSICSGSSILLRAQPGYQDYLWQDGSTDSIMTVNANGLYSVTVSNGYCSSSDAVIVTVINNPSPSIASSNPYICDGSSSTLSALAADAYLWNTGETTSSISVLNGGTYSVNVTTNGCSGSTSFSINQFSTPSLDLGNDTTACSGPAIILHAPSGNQSYVWQDGSTDSTYSVIASGSYSVTVNNGFCSSTDSINILLNNCPVLAANFSANQTYVCFNTCIDFTDLSQNATSWNWFFPGAITTTSNQQNPTGICYSTPGTYSVYLVVDGSNGPQNAMMKVSYITINPLPDIPVITPNGTFLTSSHANSYQWLLNSTEIPGATIQTFDAIQSGYYSVRVTNSSGCSAISDSVYIAATITGIEKQPFKNEIFVYPNPSKGLFYLFFVNNITEKTEVEITDLEGKVLLQSLIESADKLSIQTINLADFSNGVYLLHLKTDAKNINKKIVIQR